MQNTDGSVGARIPVRLHLANESGYYLDITMYKEVTDEASGKVSGDLCFFVSYWTAKQNGCINLEL